jgi:hypothetical protein
MHVMSKEVLAVLRNSLAFAVLLLAAMAILL